jgi:hypothetical protein
MAAMGIDSITAPTGNVVVQVHSKGGNVTRVVPLHLRMVGDVEFDVHPFSLIFLDPAAEEPSHACQSRNSRA